MGRKEPYKTLLSLGWRMSKIEPALLLFGLDGKLSGLIITHVDDLYCAGEGQVYEASIIPCLQKHSGCRADGITLTGIEDGDYLRSLLPDRAQVSWQEDSRLGPPISEGDDGLLYGCKQRAWKAPSTRTRDSRQKSRNSGVPGEISDGRK